jgi:hypothetical protein
MFADWLEQQTAALAMAMVPASVKPSAAPVRDYRKPDTIKGCFKAVGYKNCRCVGCTDSCAGATATCTSQALCCKTFYDE